MKNIGLIMLLCCALVACKTKKSHVQTSSMDSLAVNREKSNIDIVAMSAKVQNTSSRMDSNWTNAIRLTNFTGTIYTDGKVEGAADQAEVSQTGTKSKDEGKRTAESNNLSLQQSDESESKTQTKKKESDSQKEVKGLTVPWWAWVLLTITIIAIGLRVLAKFKSSVKLF